MLWIYTALEAAISFAKLIAAKTTLHIVAKYVPIP
jgi:hypothetical protein